MIKQYLLTSFILLALDAVYLNFTKNYFNHQVQLVQGQVLNLICQQPLLVIFYFL